MGQRQVDQPGIEIVERQLVDEHGPAVAIRSHALEVTLTQCPEIHTRRRIDKIQSRQRSTRGQRRHLPRQLESELVQFARGADVRMTAEDPLDQRGAGARHTDDEDRLRIVTTLDVTVEAIGSVNLADPVDEAEVGIDVVTHQRALELGARP